MTTFLRAIADSQDMINIFNLIDNKRDKLIDIETEYQKIKLNELNNIDSTINIKDFTSFYDSFKPKLHSKLDEKEVLDVEWFFDKYELLILILKKRYSFTQGSLSDKEYEAVIKYSIILAIYESFSLKTFEDKLIDMFYGIKTKIYSKQYDIESSVAFLYKKDTLFFNSEENNKEYNSSFQASNLIETCNYDFDILIGFLDKELIDLELKKSKENREQFIKLYDYYIKDINYLKKVIQEDKDNEEIFFDASNIDFI